jgi:hypothetical protein
MQTNNPYGIELESPKIEPIFHLFLTQGDSMYVMHEVQARCKVPISTLYS